MMEFTPENPIVLISYQNITKSLQDYGLMDEKMALTFTSKEDLKALEEQLGMELDPQTIFKEGQFNPLGAMSIVYVVYEDSQCALAYIPSFDGQATADYILNTAQEIASKENAGIDINQMLEKESLDNGELLIIDAGFTSAGWLATKNWLIIGGCEKGPTTKARPR